jgi:hypothetical protein
MILITLIPMTSFSKYHVSALHSFCPINLMSQ